MHEYEIFIEDINPCGGEQYSKKTLIEAEAASPEAYVKENGRFPILEFTRNESGDIVIVTGDNKGSFVRYTFTEQVCLTKEEAWNLIKRIPEIPTAWTNNEKMREQNYKEAVKANSPEALVSIIKMIYQRKQKRLAQGKKCTATDARYFQIAENLLYMELGIALGKPKQEICKTIIDYITANCQ